MNLGPIFVRPAPDRRVRHPDGRPLAEEGSEVLDAPFWRRRIEDGDVLEGRTRAAPTPKKAER